MCDGCEKCTCSAEGRWTCENVRQCTKDQEQDIQEEDINRALDLLVYDIQQHETETSGSSYVPGPAASHDIDKLLEEQHRNYKIQDDSIEMKREDEILAYFVRPKRSAAKGKSDEENDNGTVIFHHTIDEINEDTLKNSNSTGTLKASKFDLIPQASRRTTLLNNSTSLQIEFAPPIDNQHAGDNKVDTPAIHDDKEDLLIHHKIFEIAGNQTQATRDKELSKLVVNELKGGAETIGERNSPVISNISFTSENDTLTAMAFIAGNLLTKLWNMEKDASENSLEIERIKHEKIQNLLELFKEPLNLRQETFLKNALAELSSAMERKEIENISLCKNIDELKRTSGLSEPSEIEPLKEKDELEESNIGSNSNKDISQNKSTLLIDSEENQMKLNKKAATVDALNKINNVLDLIKKYEQVQNSLSDFKSNSKNKNVRKSLDKNVTNDENNTLRVFGNILETLTSLLIPNKKHKKKINKGIKSKSIFGNNKSLKDKFKNLDLADMSLSVKDKIVLDYLTHMQSNPNCILSKPQEKISLPNIEGDILLNLSEFFKIKSLSDLLKLVDTDKHKQKEEAALRSEMTTLKSDVESLVKRPLFATTEANIQTTEKENQTKFEMTKEKLKLHLKTILEDLMELRSINGKTTNGKNIEIAEALPCIYNLLNVNKDLSNVMNSTKELKKTKLGRAAQVDKVTEIFDKLKKELKHTSQTRRSNFQSGPIWPRPKSALVWERTIKNLGIKNKLQYRRNSQNESPKSLEDTLKMIENLDSSGSNTYKSYAYLDEVPPAEKLLLLKTLAADTNKYITSLIDLNKTIEAITEFRGHEQNTIAEFIDNVNINVKLNEKVIKQLHEPRQDIYLSNQESKPAKRFKVYKSGKAIEPTVANNNVIKLTRDQVINQLIKNRMLYYLRLKEATGESSDSFIMDLARKILLYLEIGNNNLARQLYKIFVSKNKKSSGTDSQVFGPERYQVVNQQKINRKIASKVPLIDFIDPAIVNKGASWRNQDQLIKQLVSIKNMKV